MFVGNVNWVKLTCGFIQDLLTAQELPLGYCSADLVNLEERLRTKVFDGPGSLEIKGDVVVLLDSLVGCPWEERARALFQRNFFRQEKGSFKLMKRCHLSSRACLNTPSGTQKVKTLLFFFKKHCNTWKKSA